MIQVIGNRDQLINIRKLEELDYSVIQTAHDQPVPISLARDVKIDDSSHAGRVHVGHAQHFKYRICPNSVTQFSLKIKQV
jgi:hypothetical protein